MRGSFNISHFYCAKLVPPYPNPVFDVHIGVGNHTISSGNDSYLVRWNTELLFLLELLPALMWLWASPDSTWRSVTWRRVDHALVLGTV